ncbi:4-aminobutyrate--2-oxoglutarate transaminase [Pseudaquabacterium rugosum]|uniref:4-aminobutyrate--2-oxoglutarate transaminase n=1 Tax=Pseudaquabacterium rugosum TaxID=2984194 RepID=A0ABU9BB38_9BURK
MHRDPLPTAQTNADLMARRRAALPSGLGQAFPIFVDRAENAEVWDVEGKRYIDFAGGIAVLNTGHRHPAVVAAVQRQLERATHTCFQVLAYEPYVELAEKLNAMAPGDFAKKSFFMTTGAEAVENAIKVARAYTRRSAVIAFGGGFHGRTMMGMALTGKVAPYKLGFGPFPAEVFHAKFPCALHGVSVDDAIASIEALFKYDVEASRVAAIILEPVQGEGGFYIAPLDFVKRLRALCDAHGILLIADEVQTGAGRTGDWLASDLWWREAGVAPDVITMAKSLGGGFPISAIIGRADVMDAASVGGLGGTYSGNPLACAAALAVIEAFERDGLLERSRTVGALLVRGLQALAAKHPGIREVRAAGAMVAIELFGTDGKPDAPRTAAVVKAAIDAGLILLSCGTHGNVVRVLVPLTASDALLEEGLGLLDQALAATAPKA